MPGNPTRSWPRIALSLALTAAIIFLPALGAIIGYAQSGQPLERDLVTGGMITAAVLCALAWGVLGLLRLVTRMNKMAAGPTAGRRIDQPALIRAILADHDLPCPRCNYNLRGLPSPTCPECHEPITLEIAGPDPLKPIVWLARLALAAFVLDVARQTPETIRLIQLWPYVFQPVGTRGMILERIAYVLPPAVSILGTLILGVAAAAWVRAGTPRARAITRWRVLNAAVALLVLKSLVGILAVIPFL